MSHGDHGAPKEPIGWMDKPDVVKRLYTILYVLAGLLIVAELVLGKENAHPHPWEGLPLFYAIYGFAAFWFLVLCALPMRKFLIRAEDYYQGGGKYTEGADD